MDATSNYQSNSDDSSLEISFIDPSLLNNDGIDYESSQAWPDPFINQQHGNNGLPTPTFEPWTTISHTNQSLGCQGVAMGSSQASLSGVPYQPDDTHQMVPLFGQWPDTHPHQQSGTNWSLWQPLQNWPVAASSQGTAINLITPESLPATLPHSLPTTPGNSKDQQLSNKKPVLKSSQPWTATSSSEQSHTSGSTFESYQSEPNACLHCRKQGQPASDEEDPFTYSSSTTATDMEVPMIPCPQCLQAFYCTADCAKADYPNHLPLCDSIASNPPRPSPNHKRAILFPATKAQPEIYYLLGMSGMRQCLSLDIDQYPGTHVLCPEIKRKGVPAYTIRISIRPNALYDGTWPNQSIPATAEYKTHYSWRGNVVIYVRPDVRPTRVRYRDIDVRGFHRLYFPFNLSQTQKRLDRSTKDLRFCLRVGNNGRNITDVFASLDYLDSPRRLPAGPPFPSPLRHLHRLRQRLWSSFLLVRFFIPYSPFSSSLPPALAIIKSTIRKSHARVPFASSSSPIYHQKRREKKTPTISPTHSLPPTLLAPPSLHFTK